MANLREEYLRLWELAETPEQKQRVIASIKKRNARRKDQSSDFSPLKQDRRVVDLYKAEPDDPGFLQSMMIGAGRGFTQLGRGVGDLTGLAPHTPDSGEERRYGVLKKQHPIATSLGESAPYMAAGGLTGAAMRGTGLAANVLGQAATGGAVGGAEYAPSGKERLTNAGKEALLSGAGEVGGSLLGQSVKTAVPNKYLGKFLGKTRPTTDQVTQEAQDLGYTVLPLSGSKHELTRKVVEGGLESSIGSAPLMNRALQKNQSILNKTAAQSIGSTEDAPTDVVLGSARDRIGSVFNDIVSEGDVSIDADHPIVESILDISINKIDPLIAKGGDPVGRASDRALDVLEQGIQKGTISLKELQHQQSMLGKVAKSKSMGLTADPELSKALYDMQGELLDLIEDGLPAEDIARFKKARKQYRNLTNLEYGNVTNEITGDVSAPNLRNRLSRTDRRGYKEGHDRSPLYTGARFLSGTQPKLASSSTAERSALSGLLTGSAGFGVAGIPGIVGGLAIPAVSALTYLGNQYALNPAVTQGLRAVGQGGSRGAYGLLNEIEEL